MRKISLLLTVFCCLMGSMQAQVNMPAASPAQTITQDFGLGKITLTYSRPSVKGRTVFQEKSELAPLGELWRTGANAATRLVFTDIVSIGGKMIDTGSYVLYTIPGKTEWTIVLNKGLKNWGSSGYHQGEDIVRINVPVQKIPITVETFTMQFSNVQRESCNLQLIWANTIVSLPIKTEITDRLGTQIENALQSAEKKPYWQAANFYYDMNVNYTKALNNVNKALETNPNAFYMYLLKAKIQRQTGDIAGAKISAQKCSEEAAKQKNEDYIRSAKEFMATMK